ncbi:diphthamide biosynthesis protein 3-like isoform X2 [Balaenoptera acutorostrata]|uniref:Diphthamide biosynthesis protein 3-like isoform X2 n=1 Tax=Balaenoptera acutorostrata TaxID=9767 RepID=A0A383YRQ5_BALAC|nr:diphthamide biosynthesis protein 3-like isoform X2 [Balaenoptera acutorostrata]XP_061054178.1 diphthamide biosynthesis protein 3-like [Eubalaena glacialis]
MALFHDEMEIKDFQYDEGSETYFYPCLCGDNFCITKDQFTCGGTVPAPSPNKELVKC